jgi:TonB family protein
MERRRVTSAAALMTLMSLLVGLRVQGQGSGKYHSAGLAMAGDIAYPMNSRAPGFVTLDVGVSLSGAAQNVTVIRDVPPLTAAAQSGINGWQFTPATADGQAVPGVVRVNVAFNPFNPSGVGLPGESLQPSTGTAGDDFQPAKALKANYADYPPNTVASGTIVMQVHVESDGKIHRVSVISGKIGGLVGAATKAVKTWSFAPALYKGQAVASDVVVAFVFASPQAGTR